MNKDENINIVKKRAAAMYDDEQLNQIEAGSLEALQKIHQLLFAGIEGYDAGSVRSEGNEVSHEVERISGMPEDNFKAVIDKYAAMKKVRPFNKGNGITIRLWLNRILKEELGLIIQWHKVSYQAYMDLLRMKPYEQNHQQLLLELVLTKDIDNYEIYLEGIDQLLAFEVLGQGSIFSVD